MERAKKRVQRDETRKVIRSCASDNVKADTSNHVGDALRDRHPVQPHHKRECRIDGGVYCSL